MSGRQYHDGGSALTATTTRNNINNEGFKGEGRRRVERKTEQQLGSVDFAGLGSSELDDEEEDKEDKDYDRFSSEESYEGQSQGSRSHEDDIDDDIGDDGGDNNNESSFSDDSIGTGEDVDKDDRRRRSARGLMDGIETGGEGRRRHIILSSSSGNRRSNFTESSRIIRPHNQKQHGFSAANNNRAVNLVKSAAIRNSSSTALSNMTCMDRKKNIVISSGSSDSGDSTSSGGSQLSQSNGPLDETSILQVDYGDGNGVDGNGNSVSGMKPLFSITYDRIIYYSKPGVGSTNKHATYIRTDILNIASIMKSHKLQITHSNRSTLRLCGSYNRTAYDTIAKFKFKRLENVELMKQQYSFLSSRMADTESIHYSEYYNKGYNNLNESENVSSSMLLRKEQFRKGDSGHKVIGPGGHLHTRYNNSSQGTMRPSLWDGTDYKMNVLKALDVKLQLKMVFESFLRYRIAMKAITKFLDANERRRTKLVFELCFLSIRLNMLMARYIYTCAEVKSRKLILRKYHLPAFLTVKAVLIRRRTLESSYKKMTKIYIVSCKLHALRKLALRRLTSMQNAAIVSWIHKRSVIGRRLIFFLKWKNTFIYRNLNKLSLYNRLSKDSRLFLDINFDTMDILSKSQVSSVLSDYYRDVDRRLIGELGTIFQPSKINKILLLGRSREAISADTGVVPSVFSLDNYRIRIVRQVIAASLVRIARGDLYSRHVKAMLGVLPVPSTLGRELIDLSSTVINKIMCARRSVSLPRTEAIATTANLYYNPNFNYDNINNSSSSKYNKSTFMDRRGSGGYLTSDRRSGESSSEGSATHDDDHFAAAVGGGSYYNKSRSRRDKRRDGLSSSSSLSSSLANPYINKRNVISVNFIDKTLHLVRRSVTFADVINEHEIAMQLINKGIECLRFLKYYSRVCISKREVKMRHKKCSLRLYVIKWKQEYRTSKQYSQSKIDILTLKRLKRSFDNLKSNTIAMTRSKVVYLRRYVTDRNALVKVFDHWRRLYDECDFDKHMTRQVTKFLNSKRLAMKIAVLAVWKQFARDSNLHRRIVEKEDLKCKQVALKIWSRKTSIKQLLKRVFSIFSLSWAAWLEEEESRLSPFQIKHALFSEWKRQTDESLDVKRQEENEMKALLLRGSTLLSSFFYLWRKSARALVYDRLQAERRTYMIFRMCFYNLGVFAVQSRRNWTRFKEKVLRGTMKRVFHSWKVTILRDDIVFPMNYYHTSIKRSSLKAIALYSRMRKVIRLPMTNICFEFYAKPMFYSWIDLFNRRLRYKQGVKLLEHAVAQRYAMRVALYKMPGRLQHQLAEEHRLNRMRNPHNKILILASIDSANKDLVAPKKKWSKFDALLANKIKEEPKKMKKFLKQAREEDGLGGIESVVSHYDVDHIKSFIEFLPEPLRIRAANYNYFEVEGCSQEENTQRVYFIMSSMLHAWYRYVRYEQKLRLRERMVKVAQNRHILFRKMKHWVLVVPRTNHRHFTWVPMKSLQLHTIYVEESKVDEERFRVKFRQVVEGANGKSEEVSKKDQIDFVKYSNAYGAYERASSYISKNNF